MTTLEYVLAGVLALSAGAVLWSGMQCAQYIETIRLERNNALDRVEVLAARLRDVEPREASFRFALGFYADEETWAAPGRAHSVGFKDRGRIARDALRGSR